MKADTAIEVVNMSKSFKRVFDKPQTLKERLVFWNHGDIEVHEVLKNINLDIKKGETVALIGTNGSGKSTLLKLMTKILYPTSGTLQTQGKLTSLLELGAGFHLDFSGRENIYFNASIFGLNREEIDQRIDDIIEFSELGGFIDNPVRTYSSGMYMRLAFSIAINVDAEILLIDEILAVGDQHFQDKCFAKLEELRRSDKTIVIVSHSLGVVEKLCDRAVWIYKGCVEMDGDPVYVVSQYLKQIGIDNKEQKKKAIESGESKYMGVVFVDSPKDYSTFFKEDKVEFNGWAICDCEEGRLVVTVNGEEQENIVRCPRQDVLDVYMDQYGGMVEVDEIGWKFWLDLSSYNSGSLEIIIKIVKEQEIEICSKKIIISVES